MPWREDTLYSVVKQGLCRSKNYVRLNKKSWKLIQQIPSKVCNNVHIHQLQYETEISEQAYSNIKITETMNMLALVTALMDEYLALV
jgi:hypothetical protein